VTTLRDFSIPVRIAITLLWAAWGASVLLWEAMVEDVFGKEE
jgi:hypothetical protein